MKKFGWLFLAFVCMAPMSSAWAGTWEPRTYIGIEGHGRWVDLETGFGQPLFKRTLAQPGIFAGIHLNDYFGIELGYETTWGRSKQRKIDAGSFFPGAPTPLPAGTFLLYNTKEYVDSANLGLMVFVPVACNNLIFGSAGVSFTKIHASMTLIGDQDPTPLSPAAIFALSDSFRKEKFLPYVKVGIIHKISDCVGVRLFVDWKNLERFKIESGIFPGSLTQLKYKNSFGYGLGLSWNW